MAKAPGLRLAAIVPARDTTVGRLLRNRPAAAGIVIIGVFGLMALFAPWLTPHSPTAINADQSLHGPSREFWLGTDQLGRDQFSRLVHGARISLAIGVLTQALALALGLAVGLAAGLGGRRADSLLMRLTDVAYSFPDLLLIILLVSIFGSSATMLVLAIGLVSWTTIARLVRGRVLSLREEEFVLAARSLGASNWRIASRHLLPGVMGPVIVVATFGVPAAIFAEAALSYIGLGLPPPTPTWGILVAESFSTMRTAPVLALSAWAAIALTVLSFNYIGDGLRDAMDPRSRPASPPPADAQRAAFPASPAEPARQLRKAA